MRTLNIELEAVVLLAVRTKIRLRVWADTHEETRRIVKDFSQGKFRIIGNEIRGIEIIPDQFDDRLNGDDSLKKHVLQALKDGNTITIISSDITDSR
jgi:hypothetical protein